MILKPQGISLSLNCLGLLGGVKFNLDATIHTIHLCKDLYERYQ